MTTDSSSQPTRTRSLRRYRGLQITLGVLLALATGLLAAVPVADLPGASVSVAEAQGRGQPTPTAVRPAPAQPVPGGAATAPQPAQADMTAVNAQLRRAVAAELSAAAARAGVAIDAATFAFGSRDDVVIANSALTRAAEVTEADIATGTDLLFSYLAVPGLPTDFYTVNIAVPDGESTGRAQLRGASGSVVADFPVRYERTEIAPESPAARIKSIKVSIEIKDGHIIIDIVITFGSSASTAMVVIPIANPVPGDPVLTPDIR